MNRKLPVLCLMILAAIGCGAGTGASDSNAGESADAKTTPVVQTQGKDAKSDMSDFEKAETAKTGYRATPAVDTSDLQSAPSWELVRLDGTPVSSRELLGKVVLVDFWATWCGPCKRTIPHLIDLHEEYKDKGLEIVGISVDQQGPKVVEPFVKQNKINYPVVMGTGQVVQDFGGIRGIPTAFIISQDGKIYRKIVGMVPKERYEKDIKALLGLDDKAASSTES